MATRTTLVDRRMVTHIIQAVPSDIPEAVIKSHLGNAALSHRLIAALLGVDPTLVDLDLFEKALHTRSIREFAPGVLDSVRSHGGQFASARMATVTGGQTLESQRDRVIKFWTDWHFKPEEVARLTLELSIASQVIYLQGLVEGSLGCTYDKVDDNRCVEEILGQLPQIDGLRWIVGNTATVNEYSPSTGRTQKSICCPGYTPGQPTSTGALSV